MKIQRAEAMGLCFGVRDALELAFELPDAVDVAIHGELVHNGVVEQRLREHGFATVSERDRARTVTERSKILITAHGVSDAERGRLAALGKELIDTTCPLVRRAHDAGRRLAAEGWHVVVIGKPGHVEVEGLVGDLMSYDVVPDAESVRSWPHDRLGVICQTTVAQPRVEAILGAIRDANPQASVRFVDTTCEPTRQRIRAVETLSAACDAVVVVGGRNSNNTKQLVAMAAAHGARAYHVQGPDDLDAAWFAPDETVGLTAGTSTLDETIDAVHDALDRIAAAARVAT